MTPLYIFDLDGTIALIDHRRHLLDRCQKCGGDGVMQSPDQVIPTNAPSSAVEWADCDVCDGGKKFKPDWRAFFAACTDDLPNNPVIDTMTALVNAGADVWIWSGRSAEVMEQTKAWLQDNLSGYSEDCELCMRLEGDFTPDEELKAAWLDGLSAYDRRRLVAVFDDRDKVVAMWRSKGVACFQVAPGGF